MEEKLIEAKFTKNKLSQSTLILSVALIVLGLIVSVFVFLTGEGYKSFGFGYGGTYPYAVIYDYSLLEFFSEVIADPIDFGGDGFFAFLIYIGIVGIVLAFFFKWEMSKCSLTVTNRRVTGKASFGKSVDLPLNQISAVALGIFSRITVATSSGKIHFWFIKNREEVHSVLTNIIGKVQVESVYNQPKNAPISDADELKKYKDLLDKNIITQEEFDVKKKQLLGL